MRNICRSTGRVRRLSTVRAHSRLPTPLVGDVQRLPETVLFGLFRTPECGSPFLFGRSYPRHRDRLVHPLIRLPVVIPRDDGSECTLEFPLNQGVADQGRDSCRRWDCTKWVYAVC